MLLSCCSKSFPLIHYDRILCLFSSKELEAFPVLSHRLSRFPLYFFFITFLFLKKMQLIWKGRRNRHTNVHNGHGWAKGHAGGYELNQRSQWFETSLLSPRGRISRKQEWGTRAGNWVQVLQRGFLTARLNSCSPTIDVKRTTVM